MYRTLQHISLLLSLVMAIPVWAQEKINQDREMVSQAQSRDKQAVEEALNGWWKESMKTHDKRIEWWQDARFGMFVHWGIYSLPGGEWKGKRVGGYAEHLMRKEKITRAEYLELAHRFNPVKFNADDWIKRARDAGMRYFIITAKHHDGFAMYDSEVSDFNIIDQTPFKRDPMAELAAACKKYGIKFGFYYSHAFDWENPDAPGNDWEYKNPGGDLNLYGGRDWFDAHPELLTKAQNYVDEKAIPQIKELINKYHPDILWFDTPHKLPLSENIRILKAIRETDPDVVVNGRLARSSGVNLGDYKNTADRPVEFYPVEGDWEAIPTTNESYGYSKYDNSHKPAAFFIRLLAKSVSKGGNLLMNIGPEGDGEMDRRDTRILDSIGQWMAENGSSIYGAGRSPLPLQNWGVTTAKDGRVYLHVFHWPKGGKLVVAGLKSDISKAYLLADKAKKTLPFERINELDLSLSVPPEPGTTINTVIVLETEGVLKAGGARLANPQGDNRLLAFDASLSGGDFSFGDGKASRYYVTGWKNKGQSISWRFRLNEPAAYRIKVRYITDDETAGIYKVQAGSFSKEQPVAQNAKPAVVVTDDVGVINLDAGDHELKIIPVEIKKKELMKVLEVELTVLSGK